MKVISLLQPWATLVVIGAKKIETRSWNTKYRGNLLIHASAGFKKEHKLLCSEKPFSFFVPNWQDLPLGKIIGEVSLVDTFMFEPGIRVENLTIRVGSSNIEVLPKELYFGDFSPGRFGWLLQNPEQFSNPIPAKGSLGIWEYNLNQ